MSQITEALAEKARELQTIIKATERSAKEPADLLRISKVRDHNCYFTRKAGAKHNEETYRGYKATPEIKHLAQVDYEKKLHSAARHQLSQLMRIIPHINENDLADIYAKLPGCRKKLIEPLIPDDELYVKNWLAYQYEGKSFDETIPELLTQNGERVRSKSEKIIADNYLSLGIPYRFECPLILKDGRFTQVIHPDFTVLNVRTRKCFYHEHLGKMDDPDYVRRNLRRLELYLKNDLFPGESLLITCETSQRPLDMKILNLMIEKYLK